jgi:hypothetical protein
MALELNLPPEAAISPGRVCRDCGRGESFGRFFTPRRLRACSQPRRSPGPDALRTMREMACSRHRRPGTRVLQMTASPRGDGISPHNAAAGGCTTGGSSATPGDCWGWRPAWVAGRPAARRRGAPPGPDAAAGWPDNPIAVVPAEPAARSKCGGRVCSGPSWAWFRCWLDRVAIVASRGAARRRRLGWVTRPPGPDLPRRWKLSAILGSWEGINFRPCGPRPGRSRRPAGQGT